MPAAGSAIGTWQLVTLGTDSWQQYRAHPRITGLSNVAVLQPGGNELIDEVRLTPLGTWVTRYTHDLLVGIIIRTDPSGRTITYEYNVLGLLLHTRDERGHIPSQQQYHYARP